MEGTGEGFPEEVTSELSVDWLVEANQIGMCVWNEAGGKAWTKTRRHEPVWRVEGTRNNSTYGGHAGQAVGMVRAEAEGTMCCTKEFEL